MGEPSKNLVNIGVEDRQEGLFDLNGYVWVGILHSFS